MEDLTNVLSDGNQHDVVMGEGGERERLPVQLRDAAESAKHIYVPSCSASSLSG